MTRQSKETGPHIKKAAALLIDNLKDPSSFLKIVCDLNRMAHNWQVNNNRGNDPHFLTMVLIEELIIPWFENIKNPVAVIEEGVLRLRDIFGADGLQETNVDLLRGYANDLKDVSTTDEYHNNYMKVIDCLFDIAKLLSKYEEDFETLKAA